MTPEQQSTFDDISISVIGKFHVPVATVLDLMTLTLELEAEVTDLRATIERQRGVVEAADAAAASMSAAIQKVLIAYEAAKGYGMDKALRRAIEECKVIPVAAYRAAGEGGQG